jgi:DNA-binding CsgD family transcriptional regulator
MRNALLIVILLTLSAISPLYSQAEEMEALIEIYHNQEGKQKIETGLLLLENDNCNDSIKELIFNELLILSLDSFDSIQGKNYLQKTKYYRQKKSHDSIVYFLRKAIQQLKKEKANILLSKELELEKVNKKHVLYLWTGSIGLLLVLTIVFFLYRKNVKHRRFVLEQKNQLLESQKEITAQKLQAHKNMLTSTTNFLLQQSQLSEVLIDALKSLKPYCKQEGKAKLNTYLADLSGYSRDKSKQTFEHNFILIYPDFMKNLTQSYPDLTKTEKKVCALIKMGLSVNDISKILSQHTHSIYRIRKGIKEKMNVSSIEELMEKIKQM